MNKNIFEQIAEMFCEHCADYYESGFEDEPEGYRTAEGFLNCFKEWLEAFVDGDNDDEWHKEYEDAQHVLDHFDEVSVENINEGIEDEPMFIPVIEDNSTARYMDGQ